MDTMQKIDVNALMQIKGCYQARKITVQQYRTLKGQVLAGDGDAALKGLRTLLTRQRGEGNG